MFNCGQGLSVRTDVYLLGTLMIEVLAGRAMHRGPSIMHIINQANQSTPFDFSPDVHPHLAEICHRATHKDPDQRYQSVQDFRQAMELHIALRDALHTLEYTETLFADLKKALLDQETSERHFHRLAFQCRFGFEEAYRKSPELQEAQEGIVDTLEIMFRFEVSKGDLRHARTIFQEMKDHGASEERLKEVEALLEEAASSREKSEELSTQIQYKLMEQILNIRNKD